MKSLLDKIQQNQSVNYHTLKKTAARFRINEDQIRATFTITKDQRKRGEFYFLTVKNMDLYQQVFQRFYVTHESKKVQQALHGNSKTAKSKTSFLLVKETPDQSIPAVVVGQQSRFEHALTSAADILVFIENKENFANCEHTLTREGFTQERVHIAFGAGQSAADENFTPFLSQYKKIICLLDFDLGGMKTAQSLANQHPNKVVFHISERMREKQAKFGVPITDKEFKDVDEYTHPVVQDVKTLILNTQRFAEQEIFQDAVA